jgi:hypothetical protein
MARAAAKGPDKAVLVKLNRHRTDNREMTRQKKNAVTNSLTMRDLYMS